MLDPEVRGYIQENQFMRVVLQDLMRDLEGPAKRSFYSRTARQVDLPSSAVLTALLYLLGKSILDTKIEVSLNANEEHRPVTIKWYWISEKYRNDIAQILREGSTIGQPPENTKN